MYINHYWHFRFKYRVNSVIDCVCVCVVCCVFFCNQKSWTPAIPVWILHSSNVLCATLYDYITYQNSTTIFGRHSELNNLHGKREKESEKGRDGERTWTINAYEHQLAWQKLVNNLLQLLLSISYEKRCERANLFDIWYEYFDRFEWSGRYSIVFNHLNIRSLYPSALKCAFYYPNRFGKVLVR